MHAFSTTHKQDKRLISWSMADEEEQQPVFYDNEQEEEHPIFTDIQRGDLEAVQQHVLADAAVLEEREDGMRTTPLVHAIAYNKPAIALWLIEHRGQHDVETGDCHGDTALHYASRRGPLEVVQALVAAGANPAALTREDKTPLMEASNYHAHIDIVAFLLQQPAVKASIDQIRTGQETALSIASACGRQPVVQLLLDAGADPTTPAGRMLPLNRALYNNRHAIAALLRHVIGEADRVRALHKARSLLGAGAASLACLQGRVELGQALPLMELTTDQQHQHQHRQQQQETVRATAAFAVGVSGGEKDTGLCEDLYMKLLGDMLPGAWADKGPEA